MKRREVIYLLIIFSTFYFLFSNFIYSYQGDGKFIDRGWFRIVGYQYEINFDEINFDESPVSKTYYFSGVKPEKYILGLNIITGHEPISQNEFYLISHQYRDARVRVNVKLIEGKDKIIFNFSILPEKWVGMYRNLRINHRMEYRFSMSKKYQLQVSVSSQTPLAKPVTFRLALYGGHERVF